MENLALVAFGAALTGAITLILWAAKPIFDLVAASLSTSNVEFFHVRASAGSGFLYAQSLSGRSLVLREDVHWGYTDLPLEVLPEAHRTALNLAPMDVVVVGMLPDALGSGGFPIRVAFRVQSKFAYRWLPSPVRDHFVRRFVVEIRDGGLTHSGATVWSPTSSGATP